MNDVLKGNSFAEAAISIALYDLIGKNLDVPVYQLLGGRVRDSFPLLRPLMGGDADSNCREAEEAMKRATGPL